MRSAFALFMGTYCVLSGLTYAGTEKSSQPQRQSSHFQVTAKGQTLQARAGVPVSGVVLYETQTGQPTGNRLDDVGPNRRCNQDAYGNAQNETPCAVNPINTDIVLAGANDYRNGDASGGFYRTTDGGNSWFDALVTRGPTGVFEAAGDPVTNIDNTGRMYVAYIAFDRSGPDNGVYLQTSTDSGISWSNPVPAVAHTGGGDSDFEDKPYATCDISSSSPYQNNYYITWTKFDLGGGAAIHYSRSTDGGASFSTPARISTSSDCQFSCPAAGPNGEVYAVWFDYGNSTIKFDRSTDAGVTWDPDITVSNFNDNFHSNPCGSFRTPAYPVIGCDISNGSRRGWIYVCWADARSGNPDIYFCRSTDGGTSWSAASRVDNDTMGRWQWWQWMAVHPTTGNIGVSWLDRREDPTGCQYKTYATMSTNGGMTWIPDFAVADIASNPASSNWLGDYCGLTFHTDGFYSVWVDTRNDDGDAYAAWWGMGILAVTSPNGGETWLIGEMDTIRWTSLDYSGNVNIHINRSYPGGPWESIVTSTINDGQHPWTVTVPATTQARIRVVGSSHPSVGDTSDANFSISNAAIRVLVPNGGETWLIGTVDTIKWFSAGISGNVTIELNRTYPTGAWQILFSNITNDGVERWPVGGVTTTQARVRISSTAQPTIQDISNDNFTITNPYIMVREPNGSEVWTENETQTFVWLGAGVNGSVTIELTRDYSSGIWETLFASVPFTNYAQDWVVTGPTTTTARARISVIGDTLSDISDSNFSILPPTLRILRPNGGEQWDVASSDTVQWIGLGFEGGIRIELNRNYPEGGWDLLMDGTENDGEEVITVSGPASSHCRIRLSTLSDTLGDISDGDFSILAHLSLLYPNGGERWLIFRYGAMQWVGHGFENVKIEINRNYPAGAWETLWDSTENDGAEAVFITEPLSDHCRVKVSALEDTLFDISDGDFSIDCSQGYLALVRPSEADVPVLSWEAGTVDSTQTVSETFFMKNFGSEMIAVFRPLDLPSAEFSLATNCPGFLDLAPGEMSACEVALTFGPLASGSFYDTLLIQSNAVNQQGGYVRFPLSGEQITSATLQLDEIPREFALHPNRPNPFNPVTRISYDLPKASPITLRVFDLLGREVRTLATGLQPAGRHTVLFDGSGLASGVYLCRFQAGEFSATQKMMLLK